MAEEKNIQKIIQILDLNLSEFYREIQLFKKYSLPLSDQMEDFYSEFNRDYNDYLKLSILAIKEGEENLTKLLTQITKIRIRFLEEFIERMTSRFSKKLNSPFWFEINSDTLEILDEISGLTSREDYLKQAGEKKIEMLKGDISKFEDSIRKLSRYKDIAKIRLPYKMLFWGIPIWIGLLLSDKFNSVIILAALVLLLLLVIITYFIIKKKRVLSENLKPKKFAIAKGRLKHVFSKWSFPLLLTIILLVTFTGMIIDSKERIAKIFTTVSLELGYSENIYIIKGKSYYIPVKFSSKDKLYNVWVNLESEIVRADAYVQLPLIDSTTVIKNFQLSIPKDVPNGTYPYVFDVSFKQQSKIPFLYDGFLRQEKLFDLNVIVSDDSTNDINN